MPDRASSRAWRVLHRVLVNVDFGPDPPHDVVGAWVENETTICLVYDKRGCPTIGLRRELEPHVAEEDLALYIAYQELGEPLGSLWDETTQDEHGIHWFSGDRPEWRVY